MGVEIENSIEGSLGVALPPASLIRARTIGQIVELIAEHMGAKRAGAASAPSCRKHDDAGDSIHRRGEL